MDQIRNQRGAQALGLVLLAIGALARADSSSPEPKWGAHVDFEAKPGSKRTLGEADLFLPLAQNADTLFFGNLRTRFDNKSSREGNLGLGVRHMLPGGWNMGVYGYLDRRRSDQGNYYNQGTLGAEALGRNWDFRVNGYRPRGDRVRNLGTTGGTTTAAVAGAAIQITTTGSETREERALGGYDAEVGWRLPLFAAEERNQLRLHAGAFRFADSVVKVSGSRLRAELALAEVPKLWPGAQLTLGAETQHDNARGGQSFVSLRLRIPLGAVPERPQQFNLQERRMTAPIVRDVDIVTLSRVSASTPAAVETATVTTGGQAITLLDSATTSGAALPGAVAAAPAANAIILSGTFNTTARTIMQNGQSLMAGPITVRSASGRTATLVTSATIAGTGGADWVVEMAGNNTLSGLTISGIQNGGGLSAVLLDNGAGNITIRDNTITATQNGANGAAGINAALITNLVVSGNTITATGTGPATTMTALSLFNSTGLTVTGNTLSASGGVTNRALSVTGSTINAGATGNTISAGVCNNGGGNTGSVGFTNGTTCP